MTWNYTKSVLIFFACYAAAKTIFGPPEMGPMWWVLPAVLVVIIGFVLDLWARRKRLRDRRSSKGGLSGYEL